MVIYLHAEIVYFEEHVVTIFAYILKVLYFKRVPAFYFLGFCVRCFIWYINGSCFHYSFVNSTLWQYLVTFYSMFMSFCLLANSAHALPDVIRPVSFRLRLILFNPL